jgi:hypothetical protein
MIHPISGLFPAHFFFVDLFQATPPLRRCGLDQHLYHDQPSA